MAIKSRTQLLALFCVFVLLICSFGVRASYSCAPTPETRLSVGGSCTAEFFHPATTWMQFDESVAIYTKFLFVLVGALSLAILPIVRALKLCVSVRLVQRIRELSFTRAGPITAGSFLPCYVATHGN